MNTTYLVTVILLCTLGPIIAIGLIPVKKHCKHCRDKAVVVCETYTGEKVYLCSNCLRAFRFREKEFFKSVLPYGKEK